MLEEWFINAVFSVKEFDISRFLGAFGEGTMEEFEAFEEEAQM